MADVFISYAREDRDLAGRLAAELKGAGYSVWWDTELVGADDLYEVILSALSEAKAAVVIWSKHAVKSRFVRDEARFALFHGKLVALKTDDLDVMQVPFGFQSQHMDPVGAGDRIAAALRKLNVHPSAPPVPAASLISPAGVPHDSIEALIELIATSADGDARRRAAIRLSEMGGSRLEHAPVTPPTAPAPSLEPNTPITAEARSLMSGAFQAFSQGLLLRVPEFQLERQGVFTSIGVVTSLLSLSAALLGAVAFTISSFSLPPGLVAGGIGTAGCGLACILLHRYARRFFLSKNWWAGAVLSFFLLVMTFPVVLFVSVIVMNGPLDRAGGMIVLGITATIFGVAALLAIALAVRAGRR